MGEVRRVRRPTAGTRQFVSGVHSITPIGDGMVEVTFYVTRQRDGRLVAEPLDCSLVIPAMAIPSAIGMAFMAIGRNTINADNLVEVVH